MCEGIKQIPDLSKLTNLKAMFVHHNHFTQLPSGIEKLTNLAECALEWFRSPRFLHSLWQYVEFSVPAMSTCVYRL